MGVMTEIVVPYQFTQVTPDGCESIQTNIAVEYPVSLTVNGEIWLTFQCTPQFLEALAVGFLYNEGFIFSLDEVANIHVCDSKDNVDIWLNHSVKKPLSWKRTSGCHGGTTSMDLDRDNFQPITHPAPSSPQQIFSLVDEFLTKQPPHSESGGVHTSALADHGHIHLLLHDIGRHNSFDKIAGFILLEKIRLENPAILTSGRASSDMLQKTIRMQIPYLITMRSTSRTGIELAEEWGITLISGARRGRFTILAHPERIDLSD